MTILYLVRHGETVDNARQVMQGQLPGELNETGILQAQEVRDRLADIAFDAIVASDLKRAIDTAAIIAEPHHLTVHTTPLLRERDWGSFTGKYIPSLNLKGVWPDDIESLDELLLRARDFLIYMETTFPNQTVLAVGHGIINKAVQAVYYGKAMNEVLRMSNAEVRVLELSATDSSTGVSSAYASVTAAATAAAKGSTGTATAKRSAWTTASKGFTGATTVSEGSAGTTIVE